MKRRPQVATRTDPRVPDTALFRCRGVGDPAGSDGPPMNDITLVPMTIAAGIGLAVTLVVAGFGMLRAPVGAARGRVQALIESDSPYATGLENAVRDRQSTRLNSSH